MAAPSIAARPIRSPIALPSFKSAAPELQIEAVLPIRQGGAFDIGQSEIEFVAGMAADVVQPGSQSLRCRLRIHTERQRHVVRRRGRRALLRASQGKRCARDGDHQDRGRAKCEPLHDRFLNPLLNVVASTRSCTYRRLAYRPSRSHVAAKAPSSSSRPIRPANIGSTPTPRTTLASRILTPIQPSP